MMAMDDVVRKKERDSGRTLLSERETQRHLARSTLSRQRETISRGNYFKKLKKYIFNFKIKKKIIYYF